VESRFGKRGASIFISAYRVMWSGTRAFIALGVAALVAEVTNHPAVGAGIRFPPLVAYLVAAGLCVRATVRASMEIYRFNRLDSRRVRKLSKRQPFDTAAFDTWLRIERSAGHGVRSVDAHVIPGGCAHVIPQLVGPC
jgi:hypothetical protein